MNDIDKVTDSYLKLLLSDLNVVEVLGSIDIENIENHTTKVICRTIMGSIDILKEHLIASEKQQASNSN